MQSKTKVEKKSDTTQKVKKEKEIRHLGNEL